MLPHHARLLNRFPPEVHDYLLWYFDAGCPHTSEDGWLPSIAIAELQATQADVVLALVRANMALHRRCAEALIGRKIKYGPTLGAFRAFVSPQDPVLADQRRVLWVMRNPRLPTTGAWYRFNVLRPGMTIHQFLTRGGRRGDIRLCVRRGWIRVEHWGAFR